MDTCNFGVPKTDHPFFLGTHGIVRTDQALGHADQASGPCMHTQTHTHRYAHVRSYHTHACMYTHAHTHTTHTICSEWKTEQRKIKIKKKNRYKHEGQKEEMENNVMERNQKSGSGDTVEQGSGTCRTLPCFIPSRHLETWEGGQVPFCPQPARR